MMMNLLIGFSLSLIISLLAYAKQSLSASGVGAAVLLGTIIYGFGGWFSFLLLMVFFISASLISLFDAQKEPSNRNAVQVFANASIAAIMAILYYSMGREVYLALLIASIGVSAADTWSSEIGKRSKSDPFHIFKFTKMDKGLSGAISHKGLMAAFFASLLYMAFATLVMTNTTYILMVFLFSFLGSIIDSMLGVIQVKYKDVKTKKLTEKNTNHTVYHSGFVWLDNNLVNFLSNTLSILIMSAILLII